MRFHLLVNGSDMGLLRRGKPIEVRVKPGSHTVAIKTTGLGVLDRVVEVPPDGTVNLACTASSEGLISAARSKHTEVWDGPSPINMWLIDEGDWPDEPARENWWTVTFLSQEALADSPLLIWRLYYRVAIKHYVAFGLVASVLFSLFLFGALSQPNPSALWILFWSILLIASLAVVMFRAVARRQLPSPR